MHQRLVQFAWTIVIVLFLASLPALALARKLQSAISAPLLHLAAHGQTGFRSKGLQRARGSREC